VKLSQLCVQRFFCKCYDFSLLRLVVKNRIWKTMLEIANLIVHFEKKCELCRKRYTRCTWKT